MSESQPVDRFALRRLGPFQGVVEVVQVADARAASLDGVHWRLEVRAERPAGLWANVPASGVWRFWPFGHWSAQTGLHRVPLDPLLDAAAMVTAVEGLVVALEGVNERLPLDLRDRFEFWLLDGRHRRPLALLSSATRVEDTPKAEVSRWRAGPAEPAIEEIVARAAGPRWEGRWFERLEDGRGRPLDVGGPLWPARLFPPLTLRTRWADPQERVQVWAWLERQAPWLLTLPRLAPGDRKRLERAAAREALWMDRLWRLYPEVLQPGLLRRARVEARLRDAREGR